MDFEHLPGGERVANGLEDLARSSVTDEALLVSALECVGSPMPSGSDAS